MKYILGVLVNISIFILLVFIITVINIVYFLWTFKIYFSIQDAKDAFGQDGFFITVFKKVNKKEFEESDKWSEKSPWE